MGLDMYLTKRVYIGADFPHRKITGVIDIKADGERIPVNFYKVNSITEQVAYWRKCWTIHEWFVKHVQNGVDDCKEFRVTYDKLMELDAFSEAAAFTEDDCDMFKETVTMLADLDPNGDYYYRSSW